MHCFGGPFGVGGLSGTFDEQVTVGGEDPGKYEATQ